MLATGGSTGYRPWKFHPLFSGSLRLVELYRVCKMERRFSMRQQVLKPPWASFVDYPMNFSPNLSTAVLCQLRRSCTIQRHTADHSTRATAFSSYSDLISPETCFIDTSIPRAHSPGSRISTSRSAASTQHPSQPSISSRFSAWIRIPAS